MSLRYLTASAILAAVPFTYVYAQSVNSTSSADLGTSESGGLTEIVVTAQRKSESSQRAAVALTAVSGDELRNAGVTQPTELATVVPSLQVAPSAGPYALFYLRGVGNFSGNALSDSAVAFNSDGVFIGRPSSVTGFFYDVDRIEVVKGPQGTLYGRNATGGAINVISRKPDLNGFSGDVSADYGNYDAYHFEAAANVPISDIAAARFATIFVKHHGYMDDGTDDQNDLGGRASLLLKPNSDLTVTVVGDVFRQRGLGVGDRPVPMNRDSRQGILSSAGNAFLATQPNTLLGRTFYPLDLSPFQHNLFWGLSSTVDWKTSAGTLTLIPAFRKSSLDYVSDTPGFFIGQRENDKQTSFEGRFLTTDQFPVRLLLGGFYYKEMNEVPRYSVNQESNYNFQEFRADTLSRAGFGRLTYEVVPNVRLNVGARYTAESKDFAGQLISASRACVIPTSYFPAYVPGCPTAAAIPNGYTPPAPNFVPGADGTVTIPGLVEETGANQRNASFSRATYRGGIDWDITPENLVYASYETGFKAGGFFFSADNGTFQPEKIKAYTVGSKNRFLSNRLQVNVEGFYWLYSDQQISHLSYDSVGDVIFATENVGKATFRGVEVENQFLATENTLLSADVQYLDAKYNNFIYTTPNLNGGVDNGTSCASAGVSALVYTVDCSGKRPPYAPTWTVNLSGQQTVPLSNGAKLVGVLHGHFQTATLTGLEFLRDEYNHAYWLTDAQLSYVSMSDKFRIGAYVNNMFDRTIIANTFPTPFSFFRSSSLQPPRTFGVRVQYHF